MIDMISVGMIILEGKGRLEGVMNVYEVEASVLKV